MRSRIVIWGEDANKEKVLLALELKERENKVLIYTFPLEVATEEFNQLLLNKWRNNEEVSFPEQHTVIERNLSMTESILPDDLKVEKTDIINRAQAEWHFIVLSSKMYELYKSELDELKSKIDNLAKYDPSLWDEMVAFWSKVQEQVKEKIIFKDQANILKDRVNNLFEKLKALKKELDREFEEQSKVLADQFFKNIDELVEKIEKGISLTPLFDELKEIQNKFNDTKFTKFDRNEVRNKLDKAFKLLKEKRGSEDRIKRNSQSGRLIARYNGLIEAIKKMEASLNRDKKDREFEERKIAQTDGQLELQIRQAKLVMINERINSKELKLQDMLRLQKQLEQKIEKEKQRAAEKELKRKKEEIKEEIIEKIHEEIKEKERSLEEISDKLVSAAEEIKSAIKKPEKEKLMDALGATVGDAITNLADTVVAAAEVIGNEIKHAVESITEEE